MSKVKNRRGKAKQKKGGKPVPPTPRKKKGGVQKLGGGTRRTDTGKKRSRGDAPPGRKRGETRPQNGQKRNRGGVEQPRNTTPFRTLR